MVKMKKNVNRFLENNFYPNITRSCDIQEFLLIVYLSTMREKTTNNENIAQLTLREQDVFNLLLMGNAPKEIVKALDISYNTILAHQKSIYRKLGVHTIMSFWLNITRSCSKQNVFLRYIVNNYVHKLLSLLRRKQ